MLRVTHINRVGVKMLKRRENRSHRKYHLDEAKRLRDRANTFKRDYEEQIASAHSTGLINDAMRDECIKEVDRLYHGMLSEAIAEENSKCMDEGKHRG